MKTKSNEVRNKQKLTKQNLMKAISLNKEIDGKITIQIKGIDLSNANLKILENIGGYNDQLNIDGYNSQGNIGGFNSQYNIGGYNNQYNIGEYNDQLNIYGYNDQGNIDGYNSQGDIGGSNDQGNIGGSNDQDDIGGYNDQSNIGGYNSQGDIGGYNSQWNINESNYQRNISGDNNQLNIGGFSINSKHWVDKKENIKTLDVDCTDGVLLHSTKVRKLKNGVEYIEGISDINNKQFLVKTQNISYHSHISINDAKKGWKIKRDKMILGVKDFFDECKSKQKISIKDFMEATGSCRPGTIAWLNKAGVKYDEDLSNEYDWDYAINLFKKYPAKELRGILELENE